MNHEPMNPVSADQPCPVCKKTDWCLVAPNGSACLCQRVESSKRCGEAGWLHTFGGAPESKPLNTDFAGLAVKFAANLTDALRSELAATLALPVGALDALPLLGFNPDDSFGRCYTHPETDAPGAIIGINRRAAGGKKAMKGSKRGLTLPVGWKDRAGAVFVVEGPTDTAAMTAAGLAAVGRPSNTGGVAHLAALFKDLPADRPIVMVGENDQGPDGKWPGKDGAESSAKGLASRLGRPVLVAMTPDGAKDARAWLTGQCKPDDPAEAWALAGETLSGKLLGSAASFDGTAPPSIEDGELPDDPHRHARLVRRRRPFLRFYLAGFFDWTAGAYQTIPDEELRAEVTLLVRKDFEALYESDVRRWQAGLLEEKPTVRKVTSVLVGNVLAALAGDCLIPATTTPPAWIDGATGPAPAMLVVTKTELVHLTTGQTIPASPSFFTFNALPFSYDPSAPPPATWLRFLAELWPGEAGRDTIEALQEWAGLLLTSDTRRQKALLMIGPRRSGKGTIMRALRELVGPWNTAGSTLSSLTTNFGLQPLLGKSVVFISDARLGDRGDAAVVTERLLSITGEDALSIDRKNKSAVTVKLDCRFVIATNELPRLTDPSGALAGRFIILRFTRSFYGKEDPTLFERLQPELPGILNWAMSGLRRLHARGRLRQTSAGEKLIRELEDLASPVGAFIRDHCRVEAGAKVPRKELFDTWCRWCLDRGHRHGTDATFGRDLRAAVPDLNVGRPMDDDTGRRFRQYEGIRLKTDSDYRAEAETEEANLFGGGPGNVHAETRQENDESPGNPRAVHDVHANTKSSRVREDNKGKDPTSNPLGGNGPADWVDIMDRPSEAGESDDFSPGPCLDRTLDTDDDGPLIFANSEGRA